MAARLQQALQESAGWRAALEVAERHAAALQSSERENREAAAHTLLEHSAEMARIAASEQHKARIMKGSRMRADQSHWKMSSP